MKTQRRPLTFREDEEVFVQHPSDPNFSAKHVVDVTRRWRQIRDAMKARARIFEMELGGPTYTALDSTNTDDHWSRKLKKGKLYHIHTEDHKKHTTQCGETTSHLHLWYKEGSLSYYARPPKFANIGFLLYNQHGTSWLKTQETSMRPLVHTTGQQLWTDVGLSTTRRKKGPQHKQIVLRSATVENPFKNNSRDIHGNHDDHSPQFPKHSIDEKDHPSTPFRLDHHSTTTSVQQIDVLCFHVQTHKSTHSHHLHDSWLAFLSLCLFFVLHVSHVSMFFSFCVDFLSVPTHPIPQPTRARLNPSCKILSLLHQAYHTKWVFGELETPFRDGWTCAAEAVCARFDTIRSSSPISRLFAAPFSVPKLCRTLSTCVDLAVVVLPLSE